MNVLVLGNHPAETTFCAPLQEAGVDIDHCDGSSPAPQPSRGSSDYDWLVLFDPPPPRIHAQISYLRNQGILAPMICVDLEAEIVLNSLRPVLVGAVERKENGEKILNCTLATGSAPHAAKKSPFGEIIYEYHAPCKA